MPPMPPDTNATRVTVLSSVAASGRSAVAVWFIVFVRLSLSLSLYRERDAHAAADAERGEAFLRIALLHLVQQRDEDAAARGADRMAERDRPAVHVHLRHVPAHLPVHGDGLRGERL